MRGLAIFLLFLVSFTIAYALKEHERTKNYYGRVDAASRRTESSRENHLKPGEASKQVKQRLLKEQTGGEAQPAMEASAVNPSDTEAEDDAAEDELHGRNPNKMSVVREQSPSHHSAGIKVMMKKRKSVAQRSIIGSSLPRSSTVSALSIFAPRILFDSTSRGLEIMDIVSKGVRVVQPNEAKLRETIVDAIKTKVDEIRERKHVIFAIPDRGGEPIVRGSESIVGMMRQTLVLSVGFEMPAMRVYCYELDVGESAVSILAPGKSGSGSGNRSATAVDRVTQKDQVRSVAGVRAAPTAAATVATAKSPAPKALIAPAIHRASHSGEGGSSGKLEKRSSGKMETINVTQKTVSANLSAPRAKSPIMPSSTCPSTCPTKKSAATPTPPQKRSGADKKASKQSSKKTGKRNSNYSRLRTARTPGAQTPQRTQVTAIEESLYSVQSAAKKSEKKSEKKKSDSDKKLYPI
ncbi:hypothetical protein PRIPAC_94833 [Pristionchus pacificus]|uniref:Uncharacterized protein n=1 Tax=Pristionchus pacificus TaxID=54126 RepID=A0A2A6BPA9_PRIPA|nr:hypothetical protein PRIPAC_94833 [Pristionchus pacificus]|eukprot:PDM67611.1 hypothetical protein PRIPAC_45655 [Pristionchus pacificus]